MERLKRVVESVAGRPRWFADDDLPPALRQLEFVNGGDGALPSADIADNQEMFREVYRVKDREDWKSWFLPFVSRFLYLAFYSILWESWKTMIIIHAEFAACQMRLQPSRISFP